MLGTSAQWECLQMGGMTLGSVEKFAPCFTTMEVVTSSKLEAVRHELPLVAVLPMSLMDFPVKFASL
jgi:hypothetical protein